MAPSLDERPKKTFYLFVMAERFTKNKKSLDWKLSLEGNHNDKKFFLEVSNGCQKVSF